MQWRAYNPTDCAIKIHSYPPLFLIREQVSKTHKY